MMSKNRFKVIEGGLKSKEDAKKTFASAYITDTRLMGAMGMCIKWHLLDCPDCDELSQFFFFDTEDMGFENYQSVWGNDRDRLFTIEHTSIGCLGGTKVPLTEKEACYLVNYYYHVNKNLNIPIPQPEKEYSFILNKKGILTIDELDILHSKMTTEIRSDFQAINYCLMRIFGKDFDGALYVSNENIHKPDLDIFPKLPLAVFYKNTITTCNGYYLCESLVHAKDTYYICTSKLSVNGLKISQVEAIQCFPVSPREAAMILQKTEYISVYDLITDDPAINETTLELPFNTTCSFHNNGRLLMVFRENNDHVNKPVFRLNEDIYGTYFITNTAQFILTAYSLDDINKLERELMTSPVGKVLSPTGKFVFHDAVMYDFIGSDLDDFMEYLEYLNID